VGDLSRLEELNVSSNGLEDLPTSLGKIPGLKLLNLNGNPLSGNPTIKNIWYAPLSSSDGKGEEEGSREEHNNDQQNEQPPAVTSSSSSITKPIDPGLVVVKRVTEMEQRTEAILQVLRTNLSDEDLTLVRERQQKVVSDRAVTAIKRALEAGNLEDAQVAQQLATEASLDLKKGYGKRIVRAVQVLTGLTEGTTDKDEKKLQQGLDEWEELSALLPSMCSEESTVGTALVVFKEARTSRLKRENREVVEKRKAAAAAALTLAAERSSASMLSPPRVGDTGDQGSAAAAAAAAQVFSHEGGTHLDSPMSMISLGKQSSVSTTVPLVRCIAFEDWEKEKVAAKLKDEQKVSEFTKNLQKQQLVEKKKQDKIKQTQMKKESGWPSAYEAEQKEHGAFTDVERLKKARQMRGNPAGKAKPLA